MQRQLEEVVHHEDGVESGLLGGHGLGGDALEQLVGSDAGIGEVGDLVADPGVVGGAHDRDYRSSVAPMIEGTNSKSVICQ